ncbi:MAG: hypothetical protein PHW18_11635 [Sulfuricurvum sp.]|uniref:4-fold beta flower protein n=1 Tax=Sulfuricurvum sp. TaxID=2025608 RepID=UPI002632E906|nr:hypothetical protein [Sulfuricurvum sp.]MDD2830215.1 hypothetical protein [Sulfuricurvum sp.]MDD4950015.1 hypothetical protein [Sulfuricurvum sp.]
MQPIFNRHGRTIGWLDNGIIYDRTNSYRAFIRDNHIFTYDAKHLGIIYNGIFRDTRGQYIAFMDDASSDPTLPIPEITPTPPIPSIPPAMPIPPQPSNISLAFSHWNPLKWEDFLDG